MFEVAMKYLNETASKTIIHLVRQRPTPVNYVVELDGNHLSKSDDELLDLSYEAIYADLFAQKKQSEQLQKIEELAEKVKNNQEVTDKALLELTEMVTGLMS